MIRSIHSRPSPPRHGFVAAAYNAGAHRVSEWLEHRRGLPRETRDYVIRVTGRSADEWRKTPLDDAALTFVRHLPCRRMPAYAELEQAQAELAQADQARARDVQLQQTEHDQADKSRQTGTLPA